MSSLHLRALCFEILSALKWTPTISGQQLTEGCRTNELQGLCGSYRSIYHWILFPGSILLVQSYMVAECGKGSIWANYLLIASERVLPSHKMHKTGAFTFSSWCEIKIDGDFNKTTNVRETLPHYGLLRGSLFLFYLMNFPRVDEDTIGTFPNKLSRIYSFYISICSSQDIVVYVIFMYIHKVLWSYSSLLLPSLALTLLLFISGNSYTYTFISSAYYQLWQPIYKILTTYCSVLSEWLAFLSFYFWACRLERVI